MNVKLTMETYEAPKVEVIEVEVENGFAASQTESFIVDDEGVW